MEPLIPGVLVVLIRGGIIIVLLYLLENLQRVTLHLVANLDLALILIQNRIFRHLIQKSNVPLFYQPFATHILKGRHASTHQPLPVNGSNDRVANALNNLAELF